MSVSLGCGHPGVAEDLLNHPDVDALLDQQRSGSVSGVVQSAVAHAGSSQHRLPLPPVVGPVDRVAGRRGEDKIVVLPRRSGHEPFGELRLPVRLEDGQQLRRALERELRAPFAGPERYPSTRAEEAVPGVPNAGSRVARVLRAPMLSLRTVRLAPGRVPVLAALSWTR